MEGSPEGYPVGKKRFSSGAYPLPYLFALTGPLGGSVKSGDARLCPRSTVWILDGSWCTWYTWYEVQSTICTSPYINGCDIHDSNLTIPWLPGLSLPLPMVPLGSVADAGTLLQWPLVICVREWTLTNLQVMPLRRHDIDFDALQFGGSPMRITYEMDGPPTLNPPESLKS